MKNQNNFKMSVLAFSYALLIVSCDKTEAEIELPKTDTQEEGFMSKTGNSDAAPEDTSEMLSPLFHEHFDGAMSKEEVAANFDEAVSKYMKENPNVSKSSTEWYYQVQTYTGTQTHNDTDANVWGRVDFVTDRGHRHLAYVELDKGLFYNSREGGWDTYFFRSTTQNPSINWLEAERATLALQGTDGWYVKYFDIHVHSADQSAAASGSTHVYSDPEQWLDNASSSGWDYYSTGTVGNGRMNF